MKTVSVLTFNRFEPAEQSQQRLQQAGIRAVLSDESRLERYWFMSEPLAVIHAEVDESDFVMVRRLIQVWDHSEAAMKEVLWCPACGSSRVEYPQITRKFAMPVVEAILMAVHVMRRRFYCLDCHFTWPKEESVEPERDLLGWPIDSKLWHPERFRKEPRT